jgi:hypothetical protein
MIRRVIELTARNFAARVVEIGLVSQEQADAFLGRYSFIDPDAELRQIDLLDWLQEFGVAVSVHCDDVDDLEQAYKSILEQAAACSGDSVTVTDVQLIEDDAGGERLRLRINGEPRSWRVEHPSDDYLDTLTMFEHMNELDPGADDPRRFHQIPGNGEGDDVYLLATPEQAHALKESFGFDVE